MDFLKDFVEEQNQQKKWCKQNFRKLQFDKKQKKRKIKVCA